MTPLGGGTLISTMPDVTDCPGLCYYIAKTFSSVVIFLFSLIFVYVQNLTPKAGGTALTEAVLMCCYFILVSGVVGVYDGFDCIVYPAHGTVVHRHS